MASLSIFLMLYQLTRSFSSLLKVLLPSSSSLSYQRFGGLHVMPFLTIFMIHKHYIILMMCQQLLAVNRVEAFHQYCQSFIGLYLHQPHS